MLLGLRIEAQRIDDLQHFAQVVATLEFAFDLAEDFADLVFDGVGAGGALLEAAQVRE